jgi:hypothetical protein
MSFFVLAVCQAALLNTNDIFIVFMVGTLVDLSSLSHVMELELE